MFYDRFVRLCERKGVSPSKAAVSAGLSKSTVTRWKSNPSIMPSGAVLESLAEYFQVPVSELLSENEKSPTEVEELKETIIEREKMRLLVQSTKDLTDEDIEKLIQIVEVMKK